MQILSLFIGLLISMPIQADETLRFEANSSIIKPFGMWEHRLPPPRRTTVIIANPKIDFSAQQVCGYTDWSTAAITVPQEILTAKYWGENLTNVRDQAINSLLAISGALPSMLACNASPTFCHVLNQAKALAQAELSYTMDSCEILDGLANTQGLQSEALRTCVQKLTNEGKKPRQAREICITNGKLDQEKNEAYESVASQIPGDIYNGETFDKAACKERTSDKYLSSHFAYTVSKTSCEWLKELFPGITIGAKASIMTGGTFQPVAEKKYTEAVRETNTYLISLLGLMHRIRYGLDPYSSKGPLPRQAVLSHSDLKEKIGLKADGSVEAICVRGSGENCEADLSQLPPIYRVSADGTEPTLLIDPATIYELVEVIGPSSTAEAEFSRKPSQLELILTRLSQASSYIKTNDILSAAKSRTVKACKGHPDLEGASAQKDCELKMAVLEAEKESLTTRRETDKDFLIAQMQFYQEVSRAKSRMMNLPSRAGHQAIRDKPKAPTELR